MDISDTLVHLDEDIDNDNSKIVLAADKVKKITPMPRFNMSTSTNIDNHKKSSQYSTSSCMKSSALET